MGVLLTPTSPYMGAVAWNSSYRGALAMIYLIGDAVALTSLYMGAFAWYNPFYGDARERM